MDNNRFVNKTISILKRQTRNRNDSISPPPTTTDANEATTKTDSSEIGLLQRPWRRITRKEKKKKKSDTDVESVYILAKRNYKVHANIGFTRRSMARFVTVLDTGASRSFVKKCLLPPSAWRRIKPLRAQVRIRDAGNRSVNICGTIDLVVELGSRLEVVQFNVVEKLAVDIILGCDFCDKHVEAIRPRRSNVELDDGTTIPIIRRPSTGHKDAVPLPEAQEWVRKPRRKSNKISVHEPIILQPETQTFVTVTCEHDGLILVEPDEKLYERHLSLVGSGSSKFHPENYSEYSSPISGANQHDFCRNKLSRLPRGTPLR